MNNQKDSFEIIVKIKHRDIEEILKEKTSMDFGEVYIGGILLGDDFVNYKLQAVYDSAFKKISETLNIHVAGTMLISQVIPAPRAMAPEFHSNIPYDLYLYINIVADGSSPISFDIRDERIKSINIDY